MTFDDTLARAKDAKASTREREAKRLAFYIFWNCKSEYDRCAYTAAFNDTSHVHDILCRPITLVCKND